MRCRRLSSSQLSLQAGEKELRSSTHIVTDDVDCGPILMVSEPLQVNYPISHDIIDRMADHYQDALKETGDWMIFPMTLEFIAKGRYARDERGNLYFDNQPIPQGVRLGNL